VDGFIKGEEDFGWLMIVSGQRGLRQNAPKFLIVLHEKEMVKRIDMIITRRASHDRVKMPGDPAAS